MNYKIIFPVVGLVVIIAIIFVLNPIQESDNTSSENFEKQAIEMVKSYKGTDGTGETLLGAIRTAFDEVYPGQDVFQNPGTNIFWSVVKDSPFSNTYKVQFHIKTSQENSLFVWIVDLDNKKVWTTHAGSIGFLNMLDQT